MLRHVPARWSREAPFSACTDSAQSPAHRRTAPGLARLLAGDLFPKSSFPPPLVFGVTGCVGTMSSHELTAPERRYEWKQTDTDCDDDRRSNPSRPSTLLGKRKCAGQESRWWASWCRWQASVAVRRRQRRWALRRVQRSALRWAAETPWARSAAPWSDSERARPMTSVRTADASKPAGRYIRSGKRGMKPSRFGIFTFGRLCAFITSCSPISLFIERM